MKKFSFTIVFCLCSLIVFCQNISYKFAAPNAIHHEAEISITATGLPLNKPAIFRMSRSSPGRYATHEFGKNIYNVKAFDAGGKVLKVEKTDAEVYSVANHQGVVTLTYTLFGNYADGTYTDVDVTGYHLNMPATFMWVKGMDKAPITISFSYPNKNWSIATQLKPAGDDTFTAPGLQYFMDSPVKIAALQWREWKEASGNKTYTFRLALDAEATDVQLDSFATNLKKIVHEAKAIYGEYPNYDYGIYTFIASINSFVRGDGMEHRNSTIITQQRKFDGSNDLLGVFSHEFFHCWNVERIRPKSLEPFNFEKSNMSEALWLAEGFTRYYGNLVQIRAGIIPMSEFHAGLASLINAKSFAPGGTEYSPIENSQRAVFVDAGVSIDRTNYENMFSSYYTYGGAIALALDLELRSLYNKSADDFMKELWKRFGKNELPYTLNGLQQALASITNAAYADGFFKKYVYGHEPFDYNKYLTNAQLSTAPASDEVSLGTFDIRNVRGQLMLAAPAVKGTPLYDAGFDFGDVILSLDNQPVKSIEELMAILKRHTAGDSVPLSYTHRNIPMSSMIKLMPTKAIKLEQAPEKLSGQQQVFAETWLGTHVK